MSEYIFAASQQEQELRRLRLIEEALDFETQERLRSTGIQPGWHCLEVGAGAGSIAEWMGNAVGEQGRVVAVDLRTDHLQHLSKPPYQVINGDFLDTSVAGNFSFDLAHCRYVLIHNRKSQSLLAKFAALLNPGGFLVVEEPDFTSANLLNKQADASQQRVNSAICRMFEQMQLDPAYGLSLPANIAAEGLQILRTDARIHLHRGQDTMARMMGESTRALRDKYVATGIAGPEDIESYIENANKSDYWTIYYSTVSVIAVKARPNV